MEAVKKALGWCTASDNGTVYAYQFWEDGTITRMELVRDRSMPYEPVQEVTGLLITYGGDVPEDIKERAKRIV